MFGCLVTSITNPEILKHVPQRPYRMFFNRPSHLFSWRIIILTQSFVYRPWWKVNSGFDMQRLCPRYPAKPSKTLGSWRILKRHVLWDEHLCFSMEFWVLLVWMVSRSRCFAFGVFTSTGKRLYIYQLSKSLKTTKNPSNFTIQHHYKTLKPYKNIALPPREI